MFKIGLLFFLCFPGLATQIPHLTPSHCAWWMQRLDDISLYEKLRMDSWEKIYRAEGYQAALEFDMDLKRRIVEMMKKINLATSEKPK